MNSDDPLLAALSDANPVDPATQPGRDETAHAHVIRHRILSSPPQRRSRAAVLVPIGSTLAAVAVVGIFLALGGPMHRDTSTVATSRQTIVFRALPTPQVPTVTKTAMDRELRVVRHRLSALPGAVHATIAGTDRIKVLIGRTIPPAQRARIVSIVARSAQLSFYDWEANVLAPSGQTVASLLPAHNPDALRISQGDAVGSGSPGNGSLTLYDAVKIASGRPKSNSRSLSRIGPQYYLFGDPGSAACAEAATAQGYPLANGHNCLLAGPDEEPTDISRSQVINRLDAALPPGVTAAQATTQGHILSVPQGTVVVEAADPSSSNSTPFTSPAARFYVLNDNVALTGKDITNSRAGRAQSGAPEVTFNFTAYGATKFQKLTAQVARRGAEVSGGPGQTDNQHFAVVLGGTTSRLLTVAQVDFKAYPDGIIQQGAGNNQAAISSGLTPASAKGLATELQAGTLPLDLRPLYGGGGLDAKVDRG